MLRTEKNNQEEKKMANKGTRIFTVGSRILFNNQIHTILAGPIFDYHNIAHYWIQSGDTVHGLGNVPISTDAFKIDLLNEED